MQWRKSPQYQSMPHGEYMNTSEGQRAQQAFQQWGQWSAGQPAARPGQAQSQQSPWASSTTYNPQSAGGFGAYTRPARQPQAAPAVLYAAPGGGWQGGTFPPMGQPPMGHFPTPGSPPMGGSPPWMGDALPPPPPPTRQPVGRQPVTRPQQPVRPSGTPGQYSGMPAGTPPSLAPFFEQAQQMFPGLDRFGQREAAYKLRNQQQAQQRRALQDLDDQAMADWQAKQARYGQDIKDVPRRPRLTRRV